MTVLRALLRLLPTLASLGMLALAGLVVTDHLRIMPVLSGSMSPHYPVGTLVAVTPVPARTLRVGDVVMFVPPKPYGTPTGGPIMHRIVFLGSGPDGHLQLRTKGDANSAQDPWTLDGERGGFARLRASSVAAGRVLAVLRHTTSGPAVLLWPGLVLLVLGRSLSRRGGAASAPVATRSSATSPQPSARPVPLAHTVTAPPVVPLPRRHRGHQPRHLAGYPRPSVLAGQASEPS